MRRGGELILLLNRSLHVKNSAALYIKILKRPIMGIEKLSVQTYHGK